ncbi:GNAT family N-acetyltransferase [Spirillospora sp. CA-294931]|uniref:GNAT family N-acetyltransferase n=1 Tax=Spirillospora sp. CA-294931 TaxID=3240042 RepID=UPI003D8E17A8
MSSAWTGERVLLRGIEPGDWQTFKEFDEHAPDMRSGDMLHPPQSDEAYRRWTADEAARRPDADSDSYRLAIVSRKDGTMVGTLNTGDADRRAGRFAYGVSIGHRYKRSGYATEAVVLMLRFMFGERRFHKCEIGVYAFNEPSIALHRKLGFVTEGRLRDHEYFGGRHHDLVLMGLTAEEFNARHAFLSVDSPVHASSAGD